jgi:hypothetical protein
MQQSLYQIAGVDGFEVPGKMIGAASKILQLLGKLFWLAIAPMAISNSTYTPSHTRKFWRI